MASSEEGDDVAVWLTRLDIGGPSGYAPVSGACDPARSCALNRDEGLTSAFIIAHEVAHMLVIKNYHIILSLYYFTLFAKLKLNLLMLEVAQDPFIHRLFISCKSYH